MASPSWVRSVRTTYLYFRLRFHLVTYFDDKDLATITSCNVASLLRSKMGIDKDQPLEIMFDFISRGNLGTTKLFQMACMVMPVYVLSVLVWIQELKYGICWWWDHTKYAHLLSIPPACSSSWLGSCPFIDACWGDKKHTQDCVQKRLK